MIDDTQDCRYCYKYWWTIWTFTKYIATIEQLGIFFPNFCLFAHNTQHIFHFPNTCMILTKMQSIMLETIMRNNNGTNTNNYAENTEARILINNILLFNVIRM